MIPPQHTFDPSRLELWLRKQIDGFEGPLRIAQFQGGRSNPTYKPTAASGTYVLRRKPPGPLLQRLWPRPEIPFRSHYVHFCSNELGHLCQPVKALP
jgi:hypothetical protein